MPGWYKSADIIRQNLRGGKLPRSLLAAEDLLKSLDEINTHVPVEDLIECVKAHVEEKLMCGAEGTPPPTRLNMNNSVFNSPLQDCSTLDSTHYSYPQPKGERWSRLLCKGDRRPSDSLDSSINS